MRGGGAGGKFVLALSLMAAGDADALQDPQRGAATGCELLRIDAKRAEQLWQLVGRMRTLAGNELQFLSA